MQMNVQDLNSREEKKRKKVAFFQIYFHIYIYVFEIKMIIIAI